MPDKRTIDNGYIKLYRKFFDSELWQEKRKYSKAEAWIDLIEMARWGEEPETLLDKRGSYVLEFGDIYISARFLGIRWQWSKNKVIHFLEYLEKRESILFKKRDSHRTIISLVNLKVYLGWENGKKDSKRTAKGQGRDGEGTKKNPLEPEEPKKNAYGEFKNILLTLDEVEKLKNKYGKDVAKAMVERLSQHIETKKKDPYIKHYAAILKNEDWLIPKNMGSLIKSTEPVKRRKVIKA
jgi:hypothetical protein